MQVVEAYFNQRASSSRPQAQKCLRTDQSYVPMISRDDYDHMIVSLEAGLPFALDAKSLIRDMRRFELNDAMTFSKNNM
jgi:hypothetical protein